MKSVFLLEHKYKINNYYESKLIGVFSTQKKAEETIIKYQKLPGFKDYPDSFNIEEYYLDECHWVKGF
jgi:hypothetical protein